MQTPAAVAAPAGGGSAAVPADILEVVPSNQALSVVSRWLGMTEEEALAEAGPSAASQAAVPAKRPQFLGLGAKYLPHHKAVETATALNSKLRKRLERGIAARRAAAEEAEDEECGLAGKAAGGRNGAGGPGGGSSNGKGKDSNEAGGSHRGSDAGRHGDTGGRPGGEAEGRHSDDSDEELGKAAPSSKRLRVGAGFGSSRTESGSKAGAGAPGGGAAASGGGLVLGSKAAREAALLYAPVDGPGGKKGKKQGKKPGT